MSDVAAVEQRPDELPDAPAEPAPAPASDDTDLDSLLAQFERETAKPEPPETQSQPDALDRLLADVDNNARVQELQGKLDAANNSVAQARTTYELEIDKHRFDAFADETQKQCPDYTTPGFAGARLKEKAPPGSEGYIAWECQRLKIDERAARAEFVRTDALLRMLMSNPDAGQNQKQIAELSQYCGQLSVAQRWSSVLRQIQRDVIREAEKAPKPIDEDQTSLRMEISALLNGGARAPLPEEPPPDWGRMSGAEGRQKVIKDHGFDPGWS